MPTLELRLGGLDPFGQLCWVALAQQFAGSCVPGISLVVDPIDLDSRVRKFVSAHPAEFRIEGRLEAGAEGSVATVSSPGNLMPGLLGRMDRLIVEAADRPARLEPEFYWNRHVTGQFGAVLERVAVELFEPDVKKELAEYLSSISVLTCRASLITSVFDADQFMEDFLANMGVLEGYHDMQHFLIRAGSPGNEQPLLLDHVRQHPGAIYIDLSADPGLYETWNLAASMASGRYLSNANVDDRRHPKQVQVLADLLELQEQADVASSALRVTETPNLPWSTSSTCKTWFTDGQDETYSVERLFAKCRDGDLRPRNLPHCMPLWRRSIHPLRGFFNEKEYGPSADWEMWLRAGIAGSRFTRITRAYGLYLKHDASYWRRDSSARHFDDRILERFGPVTKGRLSGVPAHGQPSSDLTRFLEAHDWFGVMLCLIRLNALPAGVGLNVARVRKLALTSVRYYFGLSEFAPADPECLKGSTHEVLMRLEPVLLSCLNDFLDNASTGAEREKRQANRWGSLLVDWHLLTDCSAPLIGLALLQREFDEDLVTERMLLEAIHARDPKSFWREVQRVYRFSVPLEELADATDAVVVPPPRGESSSDAVRLVHFPSYSNKYQELLYWQASRAGIDISGVREPDELASLKPGAGGGDILHLHWLNAVFERSDGGFEKAAAGFLAQVRKLKADGFQVYWTVHNRLNHDSTQPEAERRFRAELAGLVDRVYLHHPLLRYELDWLPPSVSPWLCEHGPYVKPVSGGIGRETARKRLELDDLTRVFLWFGQLRPYKALEHRLPVILEGLKSSPRARLVVAGKVQAREVRQMLLDAGEQTIFINRHVPNIELQHLADAADFGILTYRDILTSGAMIHMYCMGLPVIAPDLGAMAGYVVPEWNGFLYRGNDELTAFVERACAMPDDEIGRFARHAATTAGSFRWGSVI